MYKIAKSILNILYSLSDIAEAEGAASISSSPEGLFSIAQAVSYKNYYEGLKRSQQEESILNGLYDPDSPFYGWGSLIYHEAIAIGEQNTHHQDAPEALTYHTADQRAQIKAIRQEWPARLEIHKRATIQPNLSMWVLRATQAALIIPDIPLVTLKARHAHLLSRCKSPDLAEKLRRLKFYQRASGVWVGQAQYIIQKI